MADPYPGAHSSCKRLPDQRPIPSHLRDLPDCLKRPTLRYVCLLLFVGALTRRKVKASAKECPTTSYRSRMNTSRHPTVRLIDKGSSSRVKKHPHPSSKQPNTTLLRLLEETVWRPGRLGK